MGTARDSTLRRGRSRIDYVVWSAECRFLQNDFSRLTTKHLAHSPASPTAATPRQRHPGPPVEGHGWPSLCEPWMASRAGRGAAVGASRIMKYTAAAARLAMECSHRRKELSYNRRAHPRLSHLVRTRARRPPDGPSFASAKMAYSEGLPKNKDRHESRDGLKTPEGSLDVIIRRFHLPFYHRNQTKVENQAELPQIHADRTLQSMSPRQPQRHIPAHMTMA